MHHRSRDQGEGVCIGGGGASKERYASRRGSASKGVGQTPPTRALQDTVTKRAVRVLLECILVFVL